MGVGSETLDGGDGRGTDTLTKIGGDGGEEEVSRAAAHIVAKEAAEIAAGIEDGGPVGEAQRLVAEAAGLTQSIAKGAIDRIDRGFRVRNRLFGDFPPTSYDSHFQAVTPVGLPQPYQTINIPRAS
jgi:hypothetical protein